MFVLKNLGPYAITAALAVCCASADAQISFEASGLPSVQLDHSPQQLPLGCGQFHQYKIVGYYSRLTLPGGGDGAAAGGGPLRHWSRLTLRANSRQFPVDIFKSASAAPSGTGHQATSCAAWNASGTGGNPLLAVEGNTARPRGYVVLCVDFVPVAPRPRGRLRLTRAVVRAGEKAPLAWKIRR